MAKNANASLREVFLQCPLFADVEPALCSQLFCEAALRSFVKGEQLYKKQSLSFLLQGSAKILSMDGGIVMRRIGPGDFFGAANLFCGESDIGNILASAPGTVAEVSEAQLRRLLAAAPQFAVNYIVFLSGRIRFLNNKIYSLTGSSTEGRLLYALRQYADASGRVVLPFPMGELANRLHIGRSSLYRTIDRLTATNQIEKKEHTIYIKGETL